MSRREKERERDTHTEKEGMEGSYRKIEKEKGNKKRKNEVER